MTTFLCLLCVVLALAAAVLAALWQAAKRQTDAALFEAAKLKVHANNLQGLVAESEQHRSDEEKRHQALIKQLKGELDGLEEKLAADPESVRGRLNGLLDSAATTLPEPSPRGATEGSVPGGTATSS